MSEKKDFTIIKNEVINSGISMKALGLFIYLKSKPKDWRFSTIRISIVLFMSSLTPIYKNIGNFLGKFKSKFIYLSFNMIPKI